MALPIPPSDELKSKYSVFGCTISKLANEYNTSNATVRGWLKKHGIERKSHKQASMEANNIKRNSIPSFESLYNHYVKDNIGTGELIKIYGVGLQTIYFWLDHYNIPRRSLSEATQIAKNKQFKDIQFSKDLLIDYLEKYSHNKLIVSEELGVSLSHIKSLVKKYDIESRCVNFKSKAELYLLEYCQSIRPDLKWISGDRSVINPYELDIYCPTLNLAIEYCGLYWHSEYYGNKNKSYHYDKWKWCNEKNIELITVFEYDDIEKIKSLIRKKCGKIDRVYARNTEVRILDKAEASSFHNKYHIHGSIGSIYNYGLFYDNELLLVASFSKSRFNKKYDWECTRCTVHPNKMVIGGVSKLFKFFIKTNNPDSIITYSDLRFGEGKTYLHCGFERIDTSMPNYWYFNKKNQDQIYSRVNFQKHKLSSLFEDFDPEMTEYQNMLKNGWDRIWDCGNAVYAYINTVKRKDSL